MITGKKGNEVEKLIRIIGKENIIKKSRMSSISYINRGIKQIGERIPTCMNCSNYRHKYSNKILDNRRKQVP